MKKKNRNTGGIGRYLLTIVITLFSLCMISGAGFGSSYLPKVDGEMQMEIPIGSNVSYFIYPQNFDDKILLVKVNVSEGKDVLVNQLQDYYEIPINTSSDNIKIELIFHLANDTELIGKKFPVSYSIFSTYKLDDTSGIVTFSPLGFSKSFVVIGKPAIVTIPPVVQPPVTQPVLTGSSSGSSSGGSSVIKPRTPVTPAQTTTNPATQTNEPELNLITNPTTDEPNITEPKKSNALLIVIIVGVIVIVGVTLIVKKLGDI
jgi:hypothetical protein